MLLRWLPPAWIILWAVSPAGARAATVVIDPAAALARIVSVPTRSVTNVNFGADGVHTLYITGVFDQFKPPYAGAVYRVTQ